MAKAYKGESGSSEWFPASAGAGAAIHVGSPTHNDPYWLSIIRMIHFPRAAASMADRSCAINSPMRSILMSAGGYSFNTFGSVA